MPIVITPNVLPGAAQSPATPDIVLQAGSVVSARVLQILAPDQARIAIGGQAIDVLTKVPLQAGQPLQLQVSDTAGGIGLAIVGQQPASATEALAGAPAATDATTQAADAAANLAALAPAAAAPIGSLTPEEALAVSIAAQTAATQQTSLATLFANLGAAAGLPGLPAQVQQALAQVLGQRIDLDQNLSASDIKQAFQASGLFLEATLAAASAQPSNAAPDLKAALIVLRQVLASSLAEVTASGTTGAPASGASTAQGAVAVVVEETSTSPEEAAQAGTPPPGTSAALAQQGAALAAALFSQNEQPADQVSAPAVIFIADSEAPAIVSPLVTPQIASAAARPSAAALGASPVISQEIFELSSAIQSLIPASTPADATARAAASGAAITLLQEVLQASPLAGGNPSRLALENGQVLSLIPAVTPSRTPAIEDGELARQNLPPPPVSGALPAAQPVAPATLAPHLPVEATLQHLLADTDGAIARQTLLQIASLPGQTDQGAGRLDPSTSRWNFEIPFATAQGTAIAQFEISRDGSSKAVEPAKPIWRARFSLDVEPAGPVHAVISFNGAQTSVRMWAERSATASQLRAKASELSRALTRADLQVGDIVVRDGAPVKPAAAPAGHFLDRAL